MASRRRLRRNSCTKKKPYNQESAEVRASVLRKQGIEVHAYMCNFSSHWHVGHRPAKLTRMIEARQGLTSLRSVGRFKRLYD